MKYVSINSHVIRANAKTGADNPPIRIGRSAHDRHPAYASEIVIQGPSRLVYNARAPVLKCGARMVLATEAPIRILR